MIPGVGHLPSVLVPTRGHLTDLFIPTPGNLPFLKKNANAQGLSRGRDGHCWNWLMHNDFRELSIRYSFYFDHFPLATLPLFKGILQLKRTFNITLGIFCTVPATFNLLPQFWCNETETSHQYRTRHSLKSYLFLFSNFSIFGGKMTSFIWHQKLFLALWSIQWQFLKKCVTRISELKKFPKYVEPIKSYGALNF